MKKQMIKILQKIFRKKEISSNHILNADILKPAVRAYRLKHDYWVHYGRKYNAGRIYIQWHTQKRGYVTQMLATPRERHEWGGGYTILLDEMKTRYVIEEIELKELNKIKPHWNKELYRVLEKFKIMI